MREEHIVKKQIINDLLADLEITNNNTMSHDFNSITIHDKKYDAVYEIKITNIKLKEDYSKDDWEGITERI